MNTNKLLGNLILSIDEGTLDVYYEEGRFAAAILGDDLDFTGHVINTLGEIVWSGEFGFTSGILPPTAKELVDAYYHYLEYGTVCVHESVVVLANRKKTNV